jgi:hypothetical protein
MSTAAPKLDRPSEKAASSEREADDERDNRHSDAAAAHGAEHRRVGGDVVAAVGDRAWAEGLI